MTSLTLLLDYSMLPCLSSAASVTSYVMYSCTDAWQHEIQLLKRKRRENQPDSRISQNTGEWLLNKIETPRNIFHSYFRKHFNEVNRHGTTTTFADHLSVRILIYLYLS